MYYLVYIYIYAVSGATRGLVTIPIIQFELLKLFQLSVYGHVRPEEYGGRGLPF